MKKIRSFATMAGLSLALLTLGVAGARAQSLSKTLFHGSINLPTQAQWGPMTLPAGSYNVYYGPMYAGGINMVEVVSKKKHGRQTFILTKGRAQTSAKDNSLVAVRSGGSLVIRKLEMATIGQSVSFSMPHNMQLMARKQTHVKYAAAKEQAQVQRIAVNTGGE